VADDTLGAKGAFSKVAKHPFSFAVLVLSLVILLVWYDLRGTLKQEQNPASMIGQDSMRGPMGSSEPLVPLGPATNSNSGRSQPQVLENLTGQQSSAAGAIGDLVGRLEEKVKSDPKNIGNRLLLAQTYKELGRADEAVLLLQELHKENPENQRAVLVLVSIYSQSDNPQEVSEALKLVQKIKPDATTPEYLLRMYTGDAMMRQNNVKDAVVQWQQALITMPQRDPNYTVLEKRVMELSAKDSANP